MFQFFLLSLQLIHLSKKQKCDYWFHLVSLKKLFLTNLLAIHQHGY
uniref:Uncharacterized protein n=1 Tax=Siphoviridae sp. ctxMM9 TaxID=2827973 RepID=A0A8S5T6R0_9CAUD|nr:MAG TPA: hypothetical protein [Siphoviridae sp. ctxMM9]